MKRRNASLLGNVLMGLGLVVMVVGVGYSMQPGQAVFLLSSQFLISLIVLLRHSLLNTLPVFSA